MTCLRSALVSTTLVLVACSSSSSPEVSSDAGGARDAAPSDASPKKVDAHDAAASHDAAESHDGATGTDAAASDASTAPISAPDDQWTWVDIAGSKCASGTETGIAVNPHAGAKELVLYLEGGGSCYDAASCWGPTPRANNVAGYDATMFAAAKQVHYPALVRTSSGNPFSAMALAYVPYCTGDMHAGALETSFTVDGGPKSTYFWGANDMDLFLARLVPTFPNLTRVYLLGTSAGGFGTLLDYDRVSRAFGVRVDIIDDSGPPLVQKGGTNNANLFAVWGYVPPSGCSGCNSFKDVLSFDRTSQPSSKYAFLSFAEDTTIAPDFGYTLAEYPTVISDFSMSLASDPGAATYVVTNEQSHVVESDLTLAPDYFPWMTLMVNDDASWQDATFAAP